MSPLIIVRKVSYSIAFKFRSFLLPKFPSSASLRHFRHELSMLLRYTKIRSFRRILRRNAASKRQHVFLFLPSREIPANTSQVDETHVTSLDCALKIGRGTLRTMLLWMLLKRTRYLMHTRTDKRNYNPNKHFAQNELHLHISKSGTRAKSRHRAERKNSPTPVSL